MVGPPGGAELAEVGPGGKTLGRGGGLKDERGGRRKRTLIGGEDSVVEESAVDARSRLLSDDGCPGREADARNHTADRLHPATAGTAPARGCSQVKVFVRNRAWLSIGSAVFPSR